MIFHTQDLNQISFHQIRILEPSLFFREGIINHTQLKGGKYK